jgi:MoaA/NifB/PqqE/SkfB family radical SAM enzyme
MVNQYFSLAHQLTQECLFRCQICNRRYEKGEMYLSQSERKVIIDKLQPLGLKRFTITGGEPMMKWDDVQDILNYANHKKVHTCLSTSGYLIDNDKLAQMDLFLDQLLISVPTLDIKKWSQFFNNEVQAKRLFETVVYLLKNINKTNIILEVCTVITRKNVNCIIELGNQLLDYNSNIIWKIEYYYPMGLNANLRNLFEIPTSELLSVQKNIKTEFEGKFKHLYIRLPRRHVAPDIFITPQGEMVTTMNNTYSKSFGNIIFSDISSFNFMMNRPWGDYEKYCRNWSW